MEENTMMCYLVQQPSSLEQLAIVKLGDWIALQAEAVISTTSHLKDTREKEAFVTRTIESIRNILECNAPRALHDKLFVEGIRALTSLKKKTEEQDTDESKRNVIEQMTETLFTKHVKLIRFYVNVSIFQSSLCFKSHLLTGLEHLRVTSYKIGREDDDVKIIQILKGLPNLKHFICCSNPFSNTNILRCLADNCKFIEHINIAISKVNDKDIDIITELSDLKILNLNYTYLFKAQIVNILQSCKKLEHLYTDTYTQASAVEDIHSKDESKETKLNLKHFYDCDSSSYEKLQLFVLMCPKIETVHLTNYSRSLEYLSPLYQLNNLSELELLGFDFYDDKVKELLEISGHNLLVLRLWEFRHLDLNALKHVGQTCPKLESLSVDRLIRFVDFEPFHTVTLQLTISNVSIFKKLKKLNFQTENVRSSKALVDELMFLLCNSPNIEDIYTWVPITDDIMLTILDRNPLVHLRELTMYENQLTEPVIEKITDNCINFPNILNVLPKDEVVDSDDYDDEYY